MSPSSFIMELRRRGVTLRVDGDDLAYRAPKGVLSSDLLAQLRAHKTAIMAALRSEAANLSGKEPESSATLQRLSRRRRLTAATTGEPLHPYARIVEPVKSELLSRANLDKRYVGGQGCYLWDENGVRYLDFVAQYGALPFGYNPEDVWQALDHVRNEKLPSVATNSLLDSAGALAEQLLEISPGDMQHVVFCSSGAEAIEIAIKLCRAATGRQGILSTRGGFHGLTIGALSIGGDPQFQDGFGVGPDADACVPYGDQDAIRQALANRPDHFAAVVIEPIQGEAGIVEPPAGYLREVREICDQFELLLVLDEVQTGLGRTGQMFACDHDDVRPDVMTLAKALGGGLMPVGAVVCNARAYSERFGLRHSSTFAGNALACQAGLASLGLLLHDDQALIRQVRYTGSYLRQGLSELKAKYPQLIRQVRGRGFMLGVVFDFAMLENRADMLGFLAQEQLLIHLLVSYLLHAEHIRVAPSFSGRDVLRIEPPLIAEERECDLFLGAVDRSLAVIETGNVAALLAPMIGLPHQEIQRLSQRFPKTQKHGIQTPAGRTPRTDSDSTIDAEFGFVVHLSVIDDLVRFDRSLEVFNQQQLEQLKSQLVDYTDPFIVENPVVEFPTGQRIRGNFVMIPYTTGELAALPAAESLELIQMAVSTAGKFGPNVIGLGGFSSVLSMGGLALDQIDTPLTSGNTLTSAAIVEALQKTCDRQGVDLRQATVAVVGATGQIGRAVSVLVAERAGRLLLVGNDRQAERTSQRLRDVMRRVESHLHRCEQQLVPIDESTNVADLAAANVVVTCTSAAEPFILSEHLRARAIVIDASRPANVDLAVRQARGDVTWIEGGLIRVPGHPRFDLAVGPESDLTFACVAETMLLALEPQRLTSQPVADIDLRSVRDLAAAAKKYGFRVVLERG